MPMILSREEEKVLGRPGRAIGSIWVCKSETIPGGAGKQRTRVEKGWSPVWNEGEAVLFKGLQQEAESQLQVTLSAYF